MMSDDLNLLGSLKAPMFLELDTYAEDALRELDNTLAQCLHLKCHEQMRNRPLGSPREWLERLCFKHSLISRCL